MIDAPAARVRYNPGQERDMASLSLTDEQIGTTWLVLNVEKVGLSQEQFFRLCRDNPELHFELSAQKELVIMTLPGGNTGRRNDTICYYLRDWVEKHGTGITFAPLTLFVLPNGAMRAPDASWISRAKWDALTDEQRETAPPLCPEFVVELRSRTDRLKPLQAKMAEYVANGAQLGWLIDPYKKHVYVYRPGAPAERLENPATISGDPVLPGFVFRTSEIW